MKKPIAKFILAAVVSLFAFGWAQAADFAVQVNNQKGTLLTTEEQIQGTEFEFGVAVEADGTTVRVEKEAAEAVAVVSGKFHSDHGSNNLKIVTAVDGPVKITFGDCTYNGGVYKVTPEGGSTIEIPQNAAACWKNGPANVTDFIYEGGATTLTIEGNSYTPYVKVAAYEAPAEPVVFRNFAVQVNNQEGTLLTADEQVQGTEFLFGIAVDAEGNVTRVASDAANALAVVSGKYHSDHGSNNLTVTVPVEGKTKVTFGNCTYNNGVYKVTPKGGNTVEIEPSEKSCWKNGHASVTEYVYNGPATTLTINGNDYTPYIMVEAVENTEGMVFDNVGGMLAWANGNESHATVTDIESAVLETSVKVGTDLTVSGPTSYSSIPEFTVPLMTYLPTTSNPGCVPGDMIEYTVKLKKGLTFTPTSVEFDVVKEGTDNAYISWSYTVDGEEGKIVAYSDPKTQIRRNNNGNPSSPYTHVEEINAEGGREFSLRFYISNVANNKKMSIGNIKIYGTVDGTEEVRAFKDIMLDFTSDPYTVNLPADGNLPEGVTVDGTFHDGQHGYNTTTVVVPVDGPVRITFGTCQYSSTPAIVKNGEETLATIDCTKDCNSTVSWVYNSEEPTTLTITTPQYCPSLAIEACELLPMVDVTYYDTDGKLLGVETIQGGSQLAYAYGEADVKVGEGQAFRGWFTSEQQTALKVAEGYTVQDNLKLYARATEIEVPTSTSRFIYDLTKQYFYVEDHEAIEIEGKYYNNHGWLVNKNGKISVNVAGKCYVTVGNCYYSAENSVATATDAEGNVIAEFPVKGESDGAEYTFTYDGPAGWLDITFPDGAYVHSVAVWNVVDFVEYDEESGYYQIPAGDVSSLLIALKAASGRDATKIFLPNGVYDLGTTVLTGISGKNISIIGESMSGTIIVNAPPKEIEGIGTTATFLNTSSDLYLQDLTLRNAMTFNGGTGRAVTLQDRGRNTICKNVSLESYQDTYYSNNNSAYFYFEDGEIHGVVDYVCGGGDVYFNRVKFVNEEIKATTIAAPNGAKKFGYVMNECSIETLCNQFNFGRSWGTYSGLAWLNTTINQPSKLVNTRFTTTGMNCAADRFVEYNSMDVDGNVISPASNVLKFTHSTGDKEYETILTAEEAAEYAIDKVFPDWDPVAIAAQVVYTSGEDLEGNVYLVDGKIYVGTLPTGDIKVRKANGRGGFGPEVAVSGIMQVGADNVVKTEYYNLQGFKVNADYQGIVICVQTTGNGGRIVTKIYK